MTAVLSSIRDEAATDLDRHSPVTNGTPPAMSIFGGTSNDIDSESRSTFQVDGTGHRRRN